MFSTSRVNSVGQSHDHRAGGILHLIVRFMSCIDACLQMIIMMLTVFFFICCVCVYHRLLLCVDNRATMSLKGIYRYAE